MVLKSKALDNELYLKRVAATETLSLISLKFLYREITQCQKVNH